MKNILSSLVILCSTFAIAAPNPADFPETLHVTGSHLVFDISGGHVIPAQRLEVIASGKKYELYGTSLSSIDNGTDHLHNGVLPIGDYKAKLIREDLKPSYLLFLSYKILLPDGKTTTLSVVGQSE